MKRVERIVGTTNFVNQTTKEVIEMNIVESVDYEKDGNFHKLFLKNFTKSLSGIINKKTALCFWILSNITRDNKLLYTYRQISQKTGYSYKTVADTMQTLLEDDFLCQFGSGYYMVNPNIIFKGRYQRRCTAMQEYNQVRYESSRKSEELHLLAIQKNIDQLEKKKANLTRKLKLKKFQEKNEEIEKKKAEETEEKEVKEKSEEIKKEEV